MTASESARIEAAVAGPYPRAAIHRAYRNHFLDQLFERALISPWGGDTAAERSRTWWVRQSPTMRRYMRRVAWREAARDFAADLAQTIADNGDDWDRAYSLNGYRAAQARSERWSLLLDSEVAA